MPLKIPTTSQTLPFCIFDTGATPAHLILEAAGVPSDVKEVSHRSISIEREQMDYFETVRFTIESVTHAGRGGSTPKTCRAGRGGSGPQWANSRTPRIAIWT
jgi:hypothetical protein